MSMFSRSAAELSLGKSGGGTKALAVTGMLIAVYVLLEVFAPINTEWLKLNFGFLPLALIGALYGPVVGAVAAIPCDILGALFKGTGVNFAFTPIAMFEGLVYGLLLYGRFSRRELALRGAFAQAIVVIISHMIFNTTAIYFFYYFGTEKTFWSLFAARAIKNAIELPLDILLLTAVVLPLKDFYFNRLN